MLRPAMPRPVASLWLVLLLAVGGALLPSVHRIQHALHADATTAGDDTASCDLLRATLAAPLPAPAAVPTCPDGLVVSMARASSPGAVAVVEPTPRGPPRG